MAFDPIKALEDRTNRFPEHLLHTSLVVRVLPDQLHFEHGLKIGLDIRDSRIQTLDQPNDIDETLLQRPGFLAVRGLIGLDPLK